MGWKMPTRFMDANEVVLLLGSETIGQSDKASSFKLQVERAALSIPNG